MTNEIRAEINKAIKKVLITQFKKDAKTEHEKVAALGYKIEKKDGFFAIRNERTQRELCIKNHSGYDFTFSFGWYSNSINWDKLNENFDFYGCLEKPQNQTYHNMKHAEEDYISTALFCYHSLEWRRKRINDYKKDIESAKKQIIKILDSIETYHRYIEQITDDLADVRHEFGLYKKEA